MTRLRERGAGGEGRRIRRRGGRGFGGAVPLIVVDRGGCAPKMREAVMREARTGRSAKRFKRL